MAILINNVSRLFCSKQGIEATEEKENFYREHYDSATDSFFVTNAAGIELSIAWNFLLADKNEFTVYKACENKSNITFISRDGIQAELPKELLKINGLEVKDGKLELPHVIYDHWFKQKSLIDHALFNRLLGGVGKILEHRDLILNNAGYFLIRHPKLFRTYGYTLTLGEWLENIDVFTGRVVQKKNGKPVRATENAVIIDITGSLLNDIHLCLAWDPERKCCITGHTPNYGRLKKYKFTADRMKYPFVLQNNSIHAQMLLNEIGA